MKELERFGRFVLKELNIDREPDWVGIIHKYKVWCRGTKHYGMAHINFTVAKILGFGAGELHKKTKKATINDARGLSYYIMDLCGYSRKEIASYYGYDPSSVTLKIQTVEGWYETNPQFKEKIDKLKDILL